MRIADTHTHLHFSGFDPDREQVIARCREAGVALQVQIGCDELSSLAALRLAESQDDMYCAVGLHPCDVLDCFDEGKLFRCRGFENYHLQAKNFDELFALFEKLITEHQEKIVGVGETGFDLYHNNSEEIFKTQTDVFLRHLSLAKAHNRPLVIHGRNAQKETQEFFTRHIRPGDIQGVIHCFSEDEAYGKFFTETYGFFLGIGGVLTYPNAEKLREAVTRIPIEFLVTETDSPFLVPQGKKKETKRNESTFLPEVVTLIAELKNIPVEECAEVLFQNAQRLFCIET
ncbi:TatD family hydrolase [Candidatus Gracilibacteria bacterium]|nr:TatD family hydrolase [Candidatus Gracilibacteria bacterium]